MTPKVEHKTFGVQFTASILKYQFLFPYAEVPPPRTEYELTDLGKTIIPILNQLSEW
ncbi:winged helix-turn-helix transcriptional regulator [Bacteroides acidifaciens]|uniref:winged helix-turn-helix transcriptional regulator n=1 Tax=Bacteroides acidifaciens TaxID=85831 RepID=UPI00333F31BA